MTALAFFEERGLCLVKDERRALRKRKSRVPEPLGVALKKLQIEGVNAHIKRAHASPQRLRGP